ncbi:LysR family transcriptional regulator [Actinoplanes sp. TBRC 11911]|uniref:LysR family transcriptional regulator n=1 Tax=Actinoplanes sp. TBRC 11911 TaxID=2729386 RepID=UPI00145EF4FA|nr:LysR family transcriptional regulator [Actinoplanes sp. TBRC 11911]NMO50035.1 LysR family transcriptional regulator [Actinoplanes sp. TBRC 11911]
MALVSWTGQITARADNRGMKDLNLRRIRYFLALGDEPHFGRAAASLHITQPVLSRQIRLLEEDVGVKLLDRDGGSVRMTEAGRRVAAEAPAIVGAAASLMRSLRDAAEGIERIRIAFMCGISPTPFTRALAARHPRLAVDFIRTTISDQTEVLHSGRADLAFVRTPFDQDGLSGRPLYTEPWFVALPTGHRAARMESVGIADLADEVLLQVPKIMPEWLSLPGKRREAPAIAENIEEKLEHVAAGHGIVVLPQQAAQSYSREELAMVKINGVRPNQVLVAWRTDATSPLIQEVAQAAANGRPSRPIGRDGGDE